MPAMKPSRIVFLGSAVLATLAIPAFLSSSFAGPPAPAAGAPAAPAAPAGNCKTFGAGKCCAPEVTMHLSKEAVFSACGQSEATFLGEAASKDTCKYHFKIAGENSEETYVQVYTPIVKEVPEKPTDPFMSFKKVGKVWVTDKAKSPKAAAQVASSTGLYLAGRGFFVSVAANAKVCSKPQAINLSKAMK
jgi:hypothetical protein